MKKKQQKHPTQKPILDIISLGMLPHDVLIGIGMSGKEFREQLEKRTTAKILESDRDYFDSIDDTSGRTLQTDNGVVYLWLKEHPTTPKAIATLAHEATHAIHLVFKYRGIEYDPDENDEMLAYGVQFLVRTILDLYN